MDLLLRQEEIDPSRTHPLNFEQGGLRVEDLALYFCRKLYIYKMAVRHR